jgi:dTDP-4-amino-4,6-dideoxygalactose transaminase
MTEGKSIPSHKRLESVVQSQFCPTWDVTACSSGTAALHLALESLLCGRTKSAVGLTCDYNMVAVPRAMVMADLEPAFIDCDHVGLMDTWTVNSEGKSKLTQMVDDCMKSRRWVGAIVVTHLFGRSVNMNKVHHDVQALREQYNRDIVVVEDMAQLHGVAPDERSNAACWSFYKNKVYHGEEGGAVAFPAREKSAYETSQSLRSLGNLVQDGMNTYYHQARGHNYRLADCLADKILESLDGKPFSHRRVQENLYDELLKPRIPDCIQPKRISPWMYDLRLRAIFPMRRIEAVRRMNAEGIEARLGFKPMSVQPEFQGLHSVNEKAHRLGGEVILLPMGEKVYDSTIERAVEILLESR